MSERQRSIVLASLSDFELEQEIALWKLKAARARHDGRSADADGFSFLAAEAIAERALRVEESRLP